MNVLIKKGAVGVSMLAALSACSGDLGEGENGGDESVATEASALDMAKFHGWEQIPNGVFASGPGYAKHDNTRALVCGRGTDARVWCGKGDSSGFQPISSVLVSSRPSVSSYLDETNTQQWAVVALAQNGALVISVTRGPSQSWGPFRTVPGGDPDKGFAHGVAIARMAGSNGAVFVVGAKREVHNADPVRYYAILGDIMRGAQSWGTWQEVPGGGIFLSAPAAVSLPGGGFVLAGEGMDLRYWYAQGTTPFTTAGWIPIGSQTFDAAPAVAARNSTQFEIVGSVSGDNRYVVGTVTRANPGEPSWGTIGNGLFKSAPTIGATSTRLDVLGWGMDNMFYINRWF